MSFHVFLNVSLLLHITCTMAKVYYVTPDDSDFINSNGTEFARSLEYYLKNTSKYFSSDSQFHFKMGHHYLNSDLVIQSVTNVTLTGESLCIIRCTSHVSITILNVTNFRLENFTFENCSSNYSNHLHNDFKYPYTLISKLSNASILLYHCMSVEIKSIAILITEGSIGFLVVNVRSYSKITNIRITVQTNCSSGNKSSLQTNGIVLYYDYWKNPSKKFSEIQLDNFQFTTKLNGSCSHPIYYAITSLLFQNNANVSVVIQNTMFTDLINVTALQYFGETCGIDVNNNLTIRNCVISNNIGYSSLKMFCIILHNIQCIRLFKRKQLYYLQQYNTISFINCMFENNFNMTSMIYVSPVSSRATTGYFYLERNTFHNNRNTHFLIMKSDTDNIWQLSNYFEISESNITANIHERGQDLMSFINSVVRFNGPIIIMDNYYYTNIGNFHISTTNICNSIIISNNTARQILRGIYIILRVNTTINITRNTVYILLKQVLTYSMNSEQICLVQFYTKLDKFNVSEMLTRDHVIMSNNVHMMSKYLPNYNGNCRWLAGNVFQKAGLHAEFVYRKLLRSKNNTVISKDKERPIPLSICQCLNPGPLSDTQYDDINCYSSHLGSIFPGQTLEVEFRVDKQWLPQKLSAVTIVVHNTEDDDCSVVDTFQLSQTHLNHKCNNYSYTLWPKNESIIVCELFIGLQNTPEMFYVQFKPCPLGFTYQENRKSCYCDPLLKNNDMIPIKSCNLNDETILRPAFSWISAKRNNNTTNTAYIVSSYCPFEHCFPHQSYLNLSNPDSQCQFNRTGLLCGKCQQGLSTVFGSHQCKRCSNMYILLIIPIAIAGVVFVIMLYIFNLTVRNGTVNTCIFYTNIININVRMFFPNCNSFDCVIFSYMNFDFRFTSCSYNGMDDYAKAWLQLVLPLYLIIIAIAFIILSRYSTTAQRLTSKRALPVLATLFLFSYTKVLIIVCNVLFRYSTITYLPSTKTELVWSISTTTPLFGVKFLALFIVCIILSLILLPFNLILLFTRTFSCLRLITTFKPILDTYFGSYKDSAYYWTGLLLLIRGIVYVLLVIDEDLRLIVISVLLGGLLCLHAAVRPFKSKFNNIQECITVLNLLAVHSVLLYKKNLVGLKISKALITIGVIYFTLAIVFHCCMYSWNNMIHKRMKWLFCKISNVKCLKYLCDRFYKAQVPQADRRSRLEIPDVTYNYREFQEPLIALEPSN